MCKKVLKRVFGKGFTEVKVINNNVCVCDYPRHFLAWTTFEVI